MAKGFLRRMFSFGERAPKEETTGPERDEEAVAEGQDGEEARAAEIAAIAERAEHAGPDAGPDVANETGSGTAPPSVSVLDEKPEERPAARAEPEPEPAAPPLTPDEPIAPESIAAPDNEPVHPELPDETDRASGQDQSASAPAAAASPDEETEEAVEKPEIVAEADLVPSAPARPVRDPSGGRVSVGERVERIREGSGETTPSRRSWLARLSQGLSRSSRDLSSNLSSAFANRQLTEEALEEMEDALIGADLGVPTAIAITETLRDTRFGRDLTIEDVRGVVASEVEKALLPVAQPLQLDLSVRPHVLLVVGVNGTGKTTTIGKLAAKLVDGGLSVTLAAGDTFRAAAIEQLKIWAERTGSEVVASKLGADAAGLAFTAYERARANGSDVVIIDTAGRLQNRTELMDELAKIIRVLKKHDPDAPHTVLQTLDATTGQNAMNQVEIFQRVAGVQGLVMTKLDGTARGGILVAIAEKFKLPVWFIGVGEKVEDLEPFRAEDFARAIAGLEQR